MDPEDLAAICHAALRAMKTSLAEPPGPVWEDETRANEVSTLEMVVETLRNPDRTPRDEHERWMNDKLDHGWKFGEVKDTIQLLHPLMIPYLDLPIEQQLKDALFVSIVRALAPSVNPEQLARY